MRDAGLIEGRGSVSHGLFAFSPTRAEPSPALIEAFRENEGDRAAIARVLGKVGPAAKDALPTLIEFMEQPKVKGTMAGDAVQEALRRISK